MISLDLFLKKSGVVVTEGHIGDCPEYCMFLSNIINNSNFIVNAMEIGMNAGHSTNALLSGNWQLNLVSFDLGSHDYVLTAKRYIDLYYPGRHTLIIGNSMSTVQIYANTTDKKFDLIFIDGGHDGNTCYADLINCKRLAHKNTVLILDDYIIDSKERHVQGPLNSWNELVSINFIKQDGVQRFREDKGFVHGHYVF